MNIAKILLVSPSPCLLVSLCLCASVVGSPYSSI
jgi:hypothetical protein